MGNLQWGGRSIVIILAIVRVRDLNSNSGTPPQPLTLGSAVAAPWTAWRDVS